jgi:hypothetical protein
LADEAAGLEEAAGLDSDFEPATAMLLALKIPATTSNAEALQIALRRLGKLI